MIITHDTIPGMAPAQASPVVGALEECLVNTIDLQLVLKHVHWNVVGREFLTVHEMLAGRTGCRCSSDDRRTRRAHCDARR